MRRLPPLRLVQTPLVPQFPVPLRPVPQFRAQTYRALSVSRLLELLENPAPRRPAMPAAPGTACSATPAHSCRV